MEPQVAFYRLSRKIINNQENIPDETRQVMYYSLAIGHHVGVMDCFAEMMSVPADQYQQLVGRLPLGEARRKLEGVLAWNEIEINRGHVDDLVPALAEALPGSDAAGAQWIGMLLQCLHEMVAEPAFYLMVKLRA